jgi:hypothetical protein
MSRRTDDWDGPGTAFVVNDAIAYLDSLTPFFWQAPGADLLGAPRKSNQRRLIVKVYEVPGRSFGKRWHVKIHQPEPETLARMSAIHRRFVVSRANKRKTDNAPSTLGETAKTSKPASFQTCPPGCHLFYICFHVSGTLYR